MARRQQDHYTKEFAEFREKVQKSDDFVVAKELAVRLPSHIKSHYSRSGEKSLYEDSLLDFFELVTHNTGVQPDRHAIEYYLELIEKSWCGPVGRRSSKLATAVYYFLQTDEHGLEIAHAIDRKLFCETYFERFGSYPPGGLEYDVDKGSADERPKQTPSWQPRLEAERVHDHPAHYSNRQIALLGRDNEQAILREFVGSQSGFRWFQLAGEGGKGKSTLAFQLISELRQEKDWEAGFLFDLAGGGSVDDWLRWQPSAHHLIVFDYVAECAPDVGKIMHILAKRALEFETDGIAVRILLLERQPWCASRTGPLDGANSDSSLSLPTGSGRSEWFQALVRESIGHDLSSRKFIHAPGFLALEGLKVRDLIAIIEALFRSENRDNSYSRQYIEDALNDVDGSGRPLYAYFLYDALKDGQFKSGWGESDLLSYIIGRDRERTWYPILEDMDRGSSEAAMAFRIAVLATIIGYLDCDLFDDADASHNPTISNSAISRASGVTASPVTETGPLGSKSRVLFGLQPDILAEFFTLKVFEANLATPEDFQLAFGLAPQRAARFLLKLAEDFYDSPELLAIFQGILGLQDEKVIEPASHAMVAVAISFRERGLSLADHQQAIEWYSRAVEIGNPNAMMDLARYKLEGLVTAKDIEGAKDLYLRVANEGFVDAMYWVGLCKANGHHFELDLDGAFLFWRSASLGGHHAAMFNLGVIYADKDLGYFNKVLAAYWWRESSARGNRSAMNNYANCCYNGDGVRMDWALAAYWWNEAAELGHTGAMRQLATCYKLGEGVEQNLERARYWAEELKSILDAAEPSTAN